MQIFTIKIITIVIICTSFFASYGEEMRKYNGCIISAVQSINQLYNIYGTYEAKTMFSQFGTKAFFKMNEPQLDHIISAAFGRVEIKETKESISYGAHEMMDKMQLSEQEQEKENPLVSSSDISNLDIGQCYISTTHPKIKAVKIQMDLETPDKRNEGFVEIGKSKQSNNATGS